MATVTVYGDSADGHVQSGVGVSGITWDTVQNGIGLAASTTNTTTTLRLYVPAVSPGSFQILQGFLRFDTAALSGKAITAVTLRDYLGVPTANLTLEARAKAWGSTLTTADWVDCDDWTANTLLASRACSTGDSAGVKDFTSEAAFAANINKGGFTELVIANALVASVSSPGARDEQISTYLSEATGTTNDPRLVLETEDEISAVFLGCNF
jgi:hypothetical protein